MNHIKNKQRILHVLVLALSIYATQVIAQDAFLTQDYSGGLDAKQSSIVNNLNAKETTKRLRVVQINTEVFDTDRFIANFFPDIASPLESMDIGHTGIRMRTWTGVTTNALGSGAFVINGRRISGHVVSTEGNFEIFPLSDDGIHAIVEHDDNKFRPCGTGTANRPFNSPGLPDNHDDNDMGRPGPQEAPGQRSVIGEECFVRVIVGYTALAQSETDDDFGRTMIEHVGLAVVESNQGYANSDVDMRMELAYMYQTSDNQTNNACNDVDDLQDTDDGKWDEIHTHRNNYDGDMVCLVTGGLYATNADCNPNGGLCGLAFGFDYTDDTNMFQVSEYDCITGNFTFAHEFGHNQGARHDNDNTGSPFSYARGYNQGVFRTIMAVCCSPVRVNFWSNPDIDHPSCDCPSGTATRDNARALDVGDATVAHHRETPATFSTGITIDDDEWLNMLASTTLNSTNDSDDGSLLQLKSFDMVKLLPGFHAMTGAQGRYYIANTCPGTTYSITEQEDETTQLTPDADGYLPTMESEDNQHRRSVPSTEMGVDGQHNVNPEPSKRSKTNTMQSADGQTPDRSNNNK